MMQMIQKVEHELKSMPIKDAVEVKTYKKDRGFVLYRNDEDLFSLIEFGFENISEEGEQHQISKLIKKVIKREFPRSNQAWVQFYQQVEHPLKLKNKQPQMQLF